MTSRRLTAEDASLFRRDGLTALHCTPPRRARLNHNTRLDSEGGSYGEDTYGSGDCKCLRSSRALSTGAWRPHRYIPIDAQPHSLRQTLSEDDRDHLDGRSHWMHSRAAVGKFRHRENSICRANDEWFDDGENAPAFASFHRTRRLPGRSGDSRTPAYSFR